MKRVFPLNLRTLVIGVHIRFALARVGLCHNASPIRYIYLTIFWNEWVTWYRDESYLSLEYFLIWCLVKIILHKKNLLYELNDAIESIANIYIIFSRL